MPVVRQVVTQSVSAEIEAALPTWFPHYVIMMELLRTWGVLDAVEKHLFLKRKGGYTGNHVLAFTVALFCASSRHPGIHPFCKSIGQQKGLAGKLAAAAGMMRFPTQASISRALSSVTPANAEDFRRHIMPLVLKQAPSMLWSSACIRDSRDGRWFFFDIDAVVSAYRERALPQDASLPPPTRRVTAKAATGYKGRKRGEKQTASSRVHNRGSGLWSGQHSVPGNPVMSEAVELAVEWLAQWCRELGIDPSHVVIRMDGAGGNGPCASLVRKAGMQLLARSANYRLFEYPSLVEEMLKPGWYAVTDSLSGPKRCASELCTFALEGGVHARMVAGAFLPQSGKKTGAGHMIGKTQFELFSTTLPPEAFPPEDIVEVYFNRGGAENDYALLKKEFRVDHTYTTNGAGQDLMTQIAMLMSNIQTVAGALISQDTLKEAPGEQRPERTGQLWDEPALDEMRATLSVRDPAPPPTHPAGLRPGAVAPSRPVRGSQRLPVLTEEQCSEVRNQLAVGWDWANGHLTCPNNKTLRLHLLETRSELSARLVMRATPKGCRECAVRPGCTPSVSSSFRKEVCLRVSGTLPGISRPDIPGDPPPPSHALAPVNRGPDPAFSPPIYVKAGNWAVTAPSIVPSGLRRIFADEAQRTTVTIKVTGAEPPRTPRPAHLALNSAQRQHRRNTYDVRLHWNDLPTTVTCNVTMTTTEALRRLLEPPA